MRNITPNAIAVTRNAVENTHCCVVIIIPAMRMPINEQYTMPGARIERLFLITVKEIIIEQTNKPIEAAIIMPIPEYNNIARAFSSPDSIAEENRLTTKYPKPNAIRKVIHNAMPK